MEKDVKRAFKNLTALGLAQATNYLLPLLTIPYLIRILGIENFGLVSIAQGFLLFLVIIPDYGFNLITTKQIAENSSNVEAINKIISSALVAKSLLLMVSFLILTLSVNLISFLNEHKTLYFLGFSMVIAQTYLPMWYFQGIEKLKFMTILNLISRLVLTGLIFFFIQSPSDYKFVIPIYATGMLVSSMTGLVIMFYKFDIRFLFPGWNIVLNDVKSGFPIFISSLANNAYISGGIILVGIFTSPLLAGYFAVADKVLLIFRQLMVALAQAIYPTMCRLRMDAEERVWQLIKSVTWPLVLLMLLASCSLYLMPSIVTQVLTGESVDEINTLIRVFSLLPVVMIFAVIINQLLLAYDYRKESMFASLFSAVFSLLINYLTISAFGILGAAWGIVATEILALLLYLYFGRTTNVFKKLKNVPNC